MKIKIACLARFALIGILCFLMTGCASFTDKAFPKYTYEQIGPIELKLSVQYDVQFFYSDIKNDNGAEIFEIEVEKVFTQSNLFSTIHAASNETQYHFSMMLQNKGESNITPFLSILTLTILPGYAKDEYLLTVDVKKNGQVLKRYLYRHSMETWIQMFMIFLSPSHSPDRAVVEVLDEMLLAFLYDMNNDKLLSGR